MSDRALVISFGVSLGLHLVLLLGQMLPLAWLKLQRPRSPIEVVYEHHVAEEELRHLEEEFSKTAQERTGSPAPANLTEPLQIRIPDRPSLAADHSMPDISLGHSPVIDLTNLVDAARGDPVLLSYFSAIREQIQHTANRRTWLVGEIGQGLIYVSFTLTSTGSVKGIDVVPERSADSATLQDVALRIVKSAAPFPPFPPSMTDPSKTIVVPLEFLIDS